MGLFISDRWVRALFCALSTAALSSSASAAFLTVTGGPTYSTSTGGYLASNYTFSGAPNAEPVPGFGDINDAGVAVGNFFKSTVPLTTTLSAVRQVGVRWSATQSPAELAGSSTDSFQAIAITPSGAVVGGRVSGASLLMSSNGSRDFSNSGGLTAKATVWPITATNQQLGDLPGGLNSGVYNVNSQGIAIGAARIPAGSRPVRWDAAGTPTELGVLGFGSDQFSYGYPVAINDAGVAVGSVGSTDTKTSVPVRWDAGGTAATQLGDLGAPAGKSSVAVAAAINNAGTIVGYAQKYDASGNLVGTRALRWDAGSTTPVELGNLGTLANGSTSSSAFKINNAGAVLGNGFKNGFQNNLRGLRWDPGTTTPVELKAFDEGFTTRSEAYDMNASGIAVGVVTSIPPTPQVTYYPGTAVYWGADGIPVNLNSLIDPASGWTLQTALAISDTGWILGVGQYDPPGSQTAYARAFILQVPEPSAMLLAMLGIACGAIASMRRKRTVNCGAQQQVA